MIAGETKFIQLLADELHKNYMSSKNEKKEKKKPLQIGTFK